MPLESYPSQIVHHSYNQRAPRDTPVGHLVVHIPPCLPCATVVVALSVAQGHGSQPER